jgi:VIT1/CCC1 family predicted Fe2+/Mn2+ transporter
MSDLNRQVALYKALFQQEKNREYQEILNELIEHKSAQLTKEPDFGTKLPGWLKIVRKFIGFTFAVKLIEGKNPDQQTKEIFEKIKEERVDFTGSIILGLNDGLIELTGVLVGFSSAFASQQVVALSGLITGIAAALSMASSAYMQARHEEGKHPVKAAIYTGIAYFIVVVLLISPYILVTGIPAARAVMFVIIFVILALVSLYTSTLFDRKFIRQFGELVIFSMGVALISFLIGSFFRNVAGVEI